jgi:GMP synthase-like glutamine amidotransferase
MVVRVFQHVPFEDVGSMAGWFEAKKATVEYTRFYADPIIPEKEDMDLLVIMGGPMSVNDEDKFPWLREEKAFVREAVTRGVAVLGVCLGAQLIASALGAKVYPNREKEIGWFPIETAPSLPGVFAFPTGCTVFHWHGETFDLPPGSTHLARSTACVNQAFQVGRRTMGLQFHLEVTPESARTMVVTCRDELEPGRYIQQESAVLAAPRSLYRKANALMADVLDYLMKE